MKFPKQTIHYFKCYLSLLNSLRCFTLLQNNSPSGFLNSYVPLMTIKSACVSHLLYCIVPMPLRQPSLRAVRYKKLYINSLNRVHRMEESITT